jgi:uncharacterized caspase-like protein
VNGKIPEDISVKGIAPRFKTEYVLNRAVLPDASSSRNIIKITACDRYSNESVKEITVFYSTGQENKYAVVIGIGNYQDEDVPDLKYSEKDAEDISNLLINYGGFPEINVWKLIGSEAAREEISKTLLEDLPRLTNENPDSTVLIYFSGHGIPEDGYKYLAPYNIKSYNVQSTGLKMEDFIPEIFSKVKSKNIIFMLDCCFSGSSTTGGGLSGRSFSRDEDISMNSMGELISGQGSSAEIRCILTASSGIELALEPKDLSNGLYTYFLIKGLRGLADSNNNNEVTLNEINSYVQEEVPKYAKECCNYIQTPGQYVVGQGNIVLTKVKSEK